jgi:succinate-semialdehyde dehydrogenase / glutarate-semialdehyde dehydrogenase
MALRSVDPTSGELIEEYEETTPSQLASILAEASCAFAGWRRTPQSERAPKMRAAADLLESRREELARLMAAEMGKPLAQGRAEADKCAWVCRYYADEAPGFLAAREVKTDASKSFVTFDPLGPVLAVMPWNFPFWQVFRFAAPALMAGNAGLLKHAGNVTGCALAIERIFHDAGFPPPLFRALLIGSERVADLIGAREVKAVTLTGSTPAGQAVAAKAGSVLKKTVLELGGSDPYLVLEDADLDAAAETCAASRLINAGQSCIAAKRFIVVEPVRAAFEERFVARMAARRVGNPLDDGVDVGPLARRDLRDALHAQVEASVFAGARVLLGGSIPDVGGAFYPATVLAGVTKGMSVYEEETFGPVAAVIAAADEKAAIAIANDSPFGLGAAVFTRDLARGERVAAELEVGSCFVNALVKSDPRLPFGGIKESGYGRELADFGIHEFVNVKSVYIK